MEPTVTLITRGAGSADDLTEQDYREIYEELRTETSLRAFAQAIRSAVSFAWWSKYERSAARLDRERRNELRAAVGLTALPRRPVDVMDEVDGDAAVWQVGEGMVDRVVMVGAEVHAPLTLRLNGDLRIVSETLAENGHVTGVTRARRRATTKAIRLYPETWERLSALRQEAGMTWEQFAAWVVELCGRTALYHTNPYSNRQIQTLDKAI